MGVLSLKGLGELGASQVASGDHALKFGERHVSRQVPEPAVGCDDDAFGGHIFECRIDPRGNLFGRLDGGVTKVQDTEQGYLRWQRGQDLRVDVRLRALERDLVDVAAVEFFE
jgi:hypothetical protein